MTMMLKVPKDKKNNSVQIKWVAIVECSAIPRFCKSNISSKEGICNPCETQTVNFDQKFISFIV